MPPVNKIILYDGICNLCNNLVRFIRKHDSRRQFNFIALQSEEGKRKLEFNNIYLSDGMPDTIYYIEDGSVYNKSTAIIKICWHLGFLWKFLIMLLIVPKILRDKLYDLISRNRYRFFGTAGSCSLNN